MRLAVVDVDDDVAHLDCEVGAHQLNHVVEVVAHAGGRGRGHNCVVDGNGGLDALGHVAPGHVVAQHHGAVEGYEPRITSVVNVVAAGLDCHTCRHAVVVAVGKAAGHILAQAVHPQRDGRMHYKLRGKVGHKEWLVAQQYR